jgi:hypothetical protein
MEKDMNQLNCIINFVNHSFLRHGSCLQRAKTVATYPGNSDLESETVLAVDCVASSKKVNCIY